MAKNMTHLCVDLIHLQCRSRRVKVSGQAGFGWSGVKQPSGMTTQAPDWPEMELDPTSCDHSGLKIPAIF